LTLRSNSAPATESVNEASSLRSLEGLRHRVNGIRQTG
jgi:hypothetical protein